jgi:tellurite resistance protein TerC
VFHRKAQAISVREALGWSAFWIALGVGFSGVIYFLYERQILGVGANVDAVTGEINNGAGAALKYLIGYLIEKSLSVDNIFVIAVLFGFFAIPPAYQHRVLFWGIFGALLMRGAMIGLGAELIYRFHWIIYLLGAFLLLTALKMLLVSPKPFNPERKGIIRLLQRWFPVTPEYQGARFIVRLSHNGKWALTPLAIALAVVETTDVAFAVDSVPAIFAITGDPFLVFTSNVFALLGLRSLYFAVAGLIEKFRYLRASLAAILAVVGVKMILAAYLKALLGENFNFYLLGVIVLILAVGMSLSVLANRRRARAPDALLARGGVP